MHGNDGDDLLIGGSTNFDNDFRGIHAVLDLWSSEDTYAEKVANLEDESFINRLVSHDTVHDDGIADVIFGGGGQDWFFLTGYVAVYDPNYDGHEHVHSEPAATSGHSHASPVILKEPPALEGFAFVDSLDKISDRAQNESLHTLIPHADELSKQLEHLTLNQLVRYDQVIHYAVASGAWSNPSTWAGGVVPTHGANVLVPIGVNVTVDRVLTARINTVRVDGTLSFSTTASSELRVDTIVVTNIGHFEMGTAAAPISANLTARVLFTNNGPIDRIADPYGIGRGLISHGSVEIHGAAVTPHAAINGSALAGATVLTLKTAPSGWKVGDSVVTASSVAGTEQNEVRRIVAIAGNRITLDQPLTFNHVPYSAATDVLIANLTRNAQFTSESSVIERRGHVMFMHNDDVHVSNAGFYKLGRTNKEVPINDSVVSEDWRLVAGTGSNSRARYSVHFHRTGVESDGHPATISGSVVMDNPGWGFVNHSSYVEMNSNVAFDVHGAGFATEVGDEIGSFRNNIALGTKGSGDAINSREHVQDFGHQGDGFWFQGTGVDVTGNIAAGNDGAAYSIYAKGLIEAGSRAQFQTKNLVDPSIANGAPTIDVSYVPLRQFSDNVGYASAIGLALRYHLRDAPHTSSGTIERITLWGNTTGVDLSYAQNVILRDSAIFRGGDAYAGIGVFTNVVTRDVKFQNLNIEGYDQGIVVPRVGRTTIDGGTYRNFKDIWIVAGVSDTRVVTITGSITMNWLYLSDYFPPINGRISNIFANDRIILDFGKYQNQRAYFWTQAGDFVPFPGPAADIPTDYIGLTAKQIWTQFGVAVGGALAPANTTTDAMIHGMIGPEG